jgi:hypothetical protein
MLPFFLSHAHSLLAAPVPAAARRVPLPGGTLAGGRIAVGDDRVLSNPEGQRQSRLNMSRCPPCRHLRFSLLLSPPCCHQTAVRVALVLAVPGRPHLPTHPTLCPTPQQPITTACTASGRWVTQTSKIRAAWWRQSLMCRGWSSSQGQTPSYCWAGKLAGLWGRTSTA